MTSTMTLVVAVGLSSAACYVLMLRADRRKSRRGGGGDTSGPDAGSTSDAGEGFNLASWFGHSATDSMGNPIDGGGSDGGDSGSGGDGGGGGGGDGGGGGGD